MAQIQEGGCHCGAVRFRAMREPVRKAACHCRSCQRRTGSAFGMGAYFNEVDVQLDGELRTYWLAVSRHVWTRSKHKWFTCPQGAEVFEQGSTPVPAKP